MRLLKKPQSYLVMFALPLVFTLIFGSLISDSGDNRIKMLVVDEDQSVLSKSYYEIITQNKLLNVSLSPKQEAADLLKNKKVECVLTIPKGFQDSVENDNKKEIVLEHTPEFTTVGTVQQSLQDDLTSVNMRVRAAKSWSTYSGDSWSVMYDKLTSEAAAKPVTLEKDTVSKGTQATSLNNMSGRAAGFSILFVMIVMMVATGTILEARKNGVWYRMMSTPASKAQILGGYILSFFVLGWIQFGMLMLLTNLLFHVTWGNIIGNIVLVSAMLLAIVGLALFIAGMVKTSEQQAAIGNIVVASTCMISGMYWPLEIEPAFMQRIADFIPQTWAMRGFTELIARGGSVSDIASYAGILLAFAAVFFIIGLYRIRYE